MNLTAMRASKRDLTSRLLFSVWNAQQLAHHPANLHTLWKTPKPWVCQNPCPLISTDAPKVHPACNIAIFLPALTIRHVPEKKLGAAAELAIYGE